MASDDLKVSIRIPGDLAKWADDQPGTRTEVVVRALTALKEGLAAPDPRVAELEGTVASLRLGIDTLARDRDQWRDRAKAIVAAAANQQRRG